MMPTDKPTMKPTTTPTEMPSEMMAPNSGMPISGSGSAGASNGAFTGQNGAICAPLMGQCGGEGATMNCCQQGECVVLSPFVSQCRDLGAKSSDDSGVSMQVVLIVVFITFLVALCCGTLLVYKLCIAKDSSADDGYYKHNSLSDRDGRGRYDDRHDRRRKDKKKSRSRDRDDSRSRTRKDRDRRTRRDSRSPKRTETRGSNSSWVDEN